MVSPRKRAASTSLPIASMAPAAEPTSVMPALPMNPRPACNMPPDTSGAGPGVRLASVAAAAALVHVLLAVTKWCNRARAAVEPKDDTRASAEVSGGILQAGRGFIGNAGITLVGSAAGAMLAMGKRGARRALSRTHHLRPIRVWLLIVGEERRDHRRVRRAAQPVALPAGSSEPRRARRCARHDRRRAALTNRDRPRFRGGASVSAEIWLRRMYSGSPRPDPSCSSSASPFPFGRRRRAG